MHAKHAKAGGGNTPTQNMETTIGKRFYVSTSALRSCPSKATIALMISASVRARMRPSFYVLIARQYRYIKPEMLSPPPLRKADNSTARDAAFNSSSPSRRLNNAAKAFTTRPSFPARQHLEELCLVFGLQRVCKEREKARQRLQGIV